MRITDSSIQSRNDICKRGEPDDHGDKVDEQMQPGEHHVQGMTDIEDMAKRPGHDKRTDADNNGPCGTEDGKTQNRRRAEVDGIRVAKVVFGDGAGIVGEDIASQAEFNNGEDDTDSEEDIEGEVEGMHCLGLLVW